MAKANKKSKMSEKKKMDTFTLVIYLVVVAVLLFTIYSVLGLRGTQATGDVVSGGSSGEDNRYFYDAEICRCIERERLTCLDGFELDAENRLCRRGLDITNVRLSCSLYECSGKFYGFDFESESWKGVDQ